MALEVNQMEIGTKYRRWRCSINLCSLIRAKNTAKLDPLEMTKEELNKNN